MKLEVRINKIINDNSKLKAIATVCIEGQFLVTGVRIYDSSRGLFVAMPSRRTINGEYRNICFPINKEFREEISKEVKNVYYQEREVVR